MHQILCVKFVYSIFRAPILRQTLRLSRTMMFFFSSTNYPFFHVQNLQDEEASYFLPFLYILPRLVYKFMYPSFMHLTCNRRKLHLFMQEVVPMDCIQFQKQWLYDAKVVAVVNEQATTMEVVNKHLFNQINANPIMGFGNVIAYSMTRPTHRFRIYIQF